MSALALQACRIPSGELPVAEDGELPPEGLVLEDVVRVAHRHREDHREDEERHGAEEERPKSNPWGIYNEQGCRCSFLGGGVN